MKGAEVGNSKCQALSFTPKLGYRCSIYENRPSTCREFDILNNNGTPNTRCQELRIKAGLMPIEHTSK
jgi:Fe-S-cluster containining protein